MKTQKLNRLFEQARAGTPPVPPPEFAADVLRAVRREPAARARAGVSVLEQLNRWFPRVAVAAVALMLLCLAADYGFTVAGVPELNDSLAPASSQLFFTVEDL